MQEGTQKQNLLLWKGVESSLGREELSYLEAKKEVHVHMQGEPEDQKAVRRREASMRMKMERSLKSSGAFLRDTRECAGESEL